MSAAIARLEDAKNHSHPQDDPPLYIDILRALWELYYSQGRYREAFHTKQFRRSLEHQYGFRAFVGALRLEPQHPLLNTTAAKGLNADALLAQEITASGRQQDVDRLIARLGRTDLKLTVIHGPSGVGKSSIVNAGLVPALKERAIGDRIALPILVNVYTDWQAVLENALRGSREPGVESREPGAEENEEPRSETTEVDLSSDAQRRDFDIQAQNSDIQAGTSDIQPPSSDVQQRISDIQPPSSDIQASSPTIQAGTSDIQPPSSNVRSQTSDIPTQTSNLKPQISPPTPPPHPLTSLPLLTAQNYLPILIFDQFEEFFFVYETVSERRPFYEFLRGCLYLDYVKVILTLREDYIHYLLEFQRYARTDGINLTASMTSSARIFVIPSVTSPRRKPKRLSIA